MLFTSILEKRSLSTDDGGLCMLWARASRDPGRALARYSSAKIPLCQSSRSDVPRTNIYSSAHSLSVTSPYDTITLLA